MSFKISSLRNLVYNGFTIANRKVLQETIGKGEFEKVGSAFKKLRTGSCNLPSFANTGHTIWIPSGEIALAKKSGQLNLTFPVSVSDIHVRGNDGKQIFTGSDINLSTITQRVRDYEKKVVDYFKNAKPLPKSAIEESKTMKKLYSPEFAPTRRLNEDGYQVTTIIDKKTCKPQEAYVRCLAKGPDPYGALDVSPAEVKTLERWGIFVKNSANEYELVGQRSFKLDKVNNKIVSDWMDSKGNNGRFSGIGLRAHQIAVERMMQEGMDTVEICALADAFPFHYKSGFRILPQENEVSAEQIERYIKHWQTNTGLTREEIEKTIVSKTVNGKKIVSSESMQNIRKLLYLKNNGKYVTGDTPMDLHGEWLEKWQEMAKSQPILL